MGNVPTSIPTEHTDQSRQQAVDKGDTMLALTWQGKDNVVMKQMPKPKIMDDKDALIRVTGSTVCGSDLVRLPARPTPAHAYLYPPQHLLHGDILQLKADDILGHEGMGIVEAIGPGVKKIKVGDRVVASFSISCGTCRFCKEKLGG